MPVISYREALSQAMREEMERDPDVFVLGEEVGHYNGAYKVTQGLLNQFSERRVIDTPIAEIGFAGIGIGAAMVGLRPIIEFMTFNFSLVAIDQIVNNAAKMLPDERGPVPRAHRLPRPRRAGGPGRVAAQPGARVVLRPRARPQGRHAVDRVRRQGPAQDRDPRRQPGGLHRGRDPVQHDRARCPRTSTSCRWARPTSSATGERRHAGRVVEDGAGCAWRRPRPWPPRASRPRSSTRGRSGRSTPTPSCASVKKTGRCVIVEVGWPTCGYGAEVAYQVQRQCLDYLDAPVERVTSDDVPMPYAKNLEDEVQPQAEDVIAAVKRALYLA